MAESQAQKIARLERELKKANSKLDQILDPPTPAEKSTVRERFSEAAELAFTECVEMTVGHGKILDVQVEHGKVGPMGGQQEVLHVLYEDEAGFPHGVLMAIYSDRTVDQKAAIRWPEPFRKARERRRAMTVPMAPGYEVMTADDLINLGVLRPRRRF